MENNGHVDVVVVVVAVVAAAAAAAVVVVVVAAVVAAAVVEVVCVVRDRGVMKDLERIVPVVVLVVTGGRVLVVDVTRMVTVEPPRG